MNEKFKVTCLWQDETVTTEYSGKWHMPALKAGQFALGQGAVFADLEVYRNGKIHKIVPIRRYADG